MLEPNNLEAIKAGHFDEPGDIEMADAEGYEGVGDAEDNEDHANSEAETIHEFYDDNELEGGSEGGLGHNTELVDEFLEEYNSATSNPWDQFLDFLADNLHRFTLGEYSSTDTSSSLSTEEILEMRDFLLQPDRPIEPPEILIYVNQTRFETLPVEIMFKVLDRLFNFHRDDEETLEIGMIHALHALGSLNQYMFDVVNHWVEGARPKWEKFKMLELQCYGSRDAVKEDIMSPWNVLVYPTSGIEESNVAVQAATTCVECFHFLVEQELVPMGGYDMNGESFLNWAIKRDCQPVVDYMLDWMPTNDFFYSTALRFGYQEDKHPLATLLEDGNQRGFEKLLDKLTQSKDVENWELGWSLSDRRLKLKMCSFLSAKRADLLLTKLKVNIGNIVMDQAIGNEERRQSVIDAPNYGRLGAIFPLGSDTSSWHEAARYNPDGDAFMEWLWKNANSKPTNINKQGYTPLMYAALGESITAFKWLAKHGDPAAPLSSRPNSREPFALRAAAFNQTFHSDEMFEILLEEMPDEFFCDFSLAKDAFGWIIDGIWSFRFDPREMNPEKPWPNERVLIIFLAKEKCQQLVNRLPDSWETSWEQLQIVTRARLYDYHFLPPSLTWKKANKQRKPSNQSLFGLTLPSIFGRQS
ncbi:hypothetical protein N7466_004108 [Penicillium verhagenii]|uniref:uncharacterized protein n=1 Tax=Penicillium verhagenii TaxID=1562060 RepID=UPI002545BD63|nr:uncharacterized protein N7466_004108 [Penicillium verhagenii]KAJ5934561.1 hypothetical protein N7466_004108 [Penicillium verhagenii]